MIELNQESINVVIPAPKPAAYMLRLNNAIIGVLKLLIESDELYHDPHIIDHIHALLDLQQALLLSEEQLNSLITNA